MSPCATYTRVIAQPFSVAARTDQHWHGSDRFPRPLKIALIRKITRPTESITKGAIHVVHKKCMHAPKRFAWSMPMYYCRNDLCVQCPEIWDCALYRWPLIIQCMWKLICRRIERRFTMYTETWILRWQLPLRQHSRKGRIHWSRDIGQRSFSSKPIDERMLDLDRFTCGVVNVAGILAGRTVLASRPVLSFFRWMVVIIYDQQTVQPFAWVTRHFWCKLNWQLIHVLWQQRNKDVNVK